MIKTKSIKNILELVKSGEEIIINPDKNKDYFLVWGFNDLHGYYYFKCDHNTKKESDMYFFNTEEDFIKGIKK